MMSAADVVYVLDLLDVANVDVWIDGGWNVDALLGQQTREHKDVDIAIRLTDRARFLTAMSAAGFEIRVQTNEYGFVMFDGRDRQVDVHLVDFEHTHENEYGETVYGGIEFVVGSLDGSGTIAGRTVRCVSARFVVRYHTRYEPDEDDYRDVLALSERFGIPLPPPYDRWGE